MPLVRAQGSQGGGRECGLILCRHLRLVAILLLLGWPRGPGPPFRRGHPLATLQAGIARLKPYSGPVLRELSIFIDESGDFGPYEKHSPHYVLSMVFHDQADDIGGHLDGIHSALMDRGLPADHAIHTGPLIRREKDYLWMQMADRRSLFKVLIDFVRHCKITHRSWVFSKREHGDSDHLVTAMSRALGEFIRENHEFFMVWDHIVVYYDNGQKEITNVVNSVFNALLSSAEVRKVSPANYSLFQAADLCCTLSLLQQKIRADGLSTSEKEFFSTAKDSAERALRRGYFKTLGRKDFSS